MTAQSGLGFSGIVAIQIPDDGAAGTVLTKVTADNYDYDWAAGGGGGAPTNAQYVVLALDATLTDERVLTAGTGISIVDGGAGGPVTISTTGAPTTLQDAYDNTGVTQPKITVSAANGAITLRDAAAPIGDLLILETNAGVDFFNVSPGTIDYGTAGNREFEILTDPTGRGTIEYLPDGRTTTTTPLGGSALKWSSLSIQAIPGGAPFGNDSMPAAVQWVGESRFDDPGFAFASGLLFNMGATITANGVNVGPIYTLVNQPRLRTGTLGGARTVSQQNAVRSQLSVGPNLAGSIVLTSHEPIFCSVNVDASGGAASITTINYLSMFAPNLIGGGTVGTLNVLNIPNIPAAGITTIRGINSAMGSGTFINHTGVAPSAFAGPIVMGNAVAVTFGTATAISLDRVAANVLRMLGNAEDLRWTFSADNVAITSTTSAGLQVNLGHISFGSSVTSGNPNWFVQFAAPNLRSPGVAGGYADVLWTAGGSIAIGALAMSDVSAFQINSIATTLAGGSIADSSTLYLAGMASANATRVHALRVTGRARIDGHINQGSQSPASIGANTNDWQLAANNNQRGVVLLTSSGAFNITGIDSSFGFAQGGDFLVIINTSGNTMSFTHQDVLSLAANRFIMATGATVAVLAGRSIRFWYDVVASRWRHILPV